MNIEFNGQIQYEEKIYTKEVMSQYINHMIDYFLSIHVIESGTIAFAVDRSPLLIAMIFAALKLHIPFLIIDADIPEVRRDYMLKTAEIHKVITTSSTFHSKEKMDIFLLNTEKIALESKEDQLKTWTSTSYHNGNAYVLCTSGSTGNPKAVPILRTGLENFILGVTERIDFKQSSTLACFTSSSFDIFFLETILALQQGLTVILANEEEKNNAKKTVKLLSENKVDMLQLTPSRLKLILMIDNQLRCLKNLKVIMVGGESLSPILLQSLREHTNAKIYNMYGPTETTIWSTISDLTDKEKIDIGMPIRNTRIYLLDDNLREVDFGEVGEICIAGDGLSEGYINNEEETKKHFIVLPSNETERIYRTGDLGAYQEDGTLFCLGRIDDQIKFNGHRIELADIEANLDQYDQVIQSAVCYDSEKEKIIAFYLSNQQIDDEILHSYMENLVPEYMIPNQFVFMEKFFYTISGKLDRKALLQFLKDRIEIPTEKENGSDEKNDILNKLMDITKQVLNNEALNITRESKLSLLGANSVHFVNIIIEIEDFFEIEVEDNILNALFDTIGKLEEYVMKQLKE